MVFEAVRSEYHRLFLEIPTLRCSEAEKTVLTYEIRLSCQVEGYIHVISETVDEPREKNQRVCGEFMNFAVDASAIVGSATQPNIRRRTRTMESTCLGLLLSMLFPK